jgi:hypothetical protein
VADIPERVEVRYEVVGKLHSTLSKSGLAPDGPKKSIVTYPINFSMFYSSLNYRPLKKESILVLPLLSEIIVNF